MTYPKTIGIIGGAGPLAGAQFLEKLFVRCTNDYGCYRDCDYPRVVLLSFPFSEMLSYEMDSEKIRGELAACLQVLKQNGVELSVIACNTLHAFLDFSVSYEGLILLPQQVITNLVPGQKPLVLCTSTSNRYQIHKQFFDCAYPSEEDQREIDLIIERILRGEDEKMILMDLRRWIQGADNQTIVLGCTELSLYSDKLVFPEKKVLDPIELTVSALLKRAFEGAKS